MHIIRVYMTYVCNCNFSYWYDYKLIQGLQECYKEFSYTLYPDLPIIYILLYLLYCLYYHYLFLSFPSSLPPYFPVHTHTHTQF